MGDIMKTTITAVLALLCVALVPDSSAFAQRQIRPIIGLRPVQVSSIPGLKQKPRAYSQQEKALAVAKFLNSSVPPALGDPVSITPDRLFVPGLVSTLFGQIRWMQFDGPSSGIIVIDDTAGAGVDIKLNVQQGKHYALDCKLDSYRLSYTVTQGAANIAEGNVAATSDRHAVFATPMFQQGGWYTVHLKYTDSVGTPMESAFWGCEISPF